MSVNGRALLDGVVVPVVTTMSASRGPDAQQMHAVLDALAEAEITKIMIFGSNGEGPVLGESEIGPFARSVSLQWRKRAPSAVLFVNVSGASTADSRRRAEAVAEAEPDALLLSPPMYYRHSRADIAEHYAAFGDLGIPVVAYNSPVYTGNDLGPDIVADLVTMEHVVGIKDSSRSEGRIAALVRLARGRQDFGVNQGDESGMLQALVDGAVGVTPGIANLAPRIAVALYQAWLSGDLAQAQHHQERLREFTGIHKIRPGVATMKAALSIRGICQSHTSAPFVEYGEDDRQRLAELLSAWDADLIGRSG